MANNASKSNAGGGTKNLPMNHPGGNGTFTVKPILGDYRLSVQLNDPQNRLVLFWIEHDHTQQKQTR